MTNAYALLSPHGRPLRRRAGVLPASRAATASKPPEPPVRPNLRPTIAARCEALGVRLTQKRRRVVAMLDLMEAPIDLETVWWKAQELGVDMNRSSLHRLASDLVSAGVLHEIGPGDRRTRYATPPSVSIEVVADPNSATPLSDPTLTELLVEALGRQGLDIGDQRIVISLQPATA